MASDQQRRNLMFRTQLFFVVTSLFCGLLAFSSAANAQEVVTPRVEIGAGYSWLYVNSADDNFYRTGNGGSGYLAYTFNRSRLGNATR
jgi:hypothetical protein